MIPRFKHDCEKCIFQGQLGKYDIYTCDQGMNWPTVIARKSDEGSDYISGEDIRLVLSEDQHVRIKLIHQ